MTELFDIGEPVKRVPTMPQPEMFILVAFYASGPWWKAWPGFSSLEKAEQSAKDLATGWTDKRIYRIPGDQPCSK